MSDTLAPLSRREANREARRDAILDVASGWFLDHGYAGTTMSAIAAALGGSKGTLWSYFPSKEQLFAAVIERVAQGFRAQLTLLLNPDDEVDVALGRFCRQFLRKVTSPEAVALHRLVVAEANRFPEVGRIFYDLAPRPTQLLLADYIAKAMEKGRLRPGDPLSAAQQLLAMCLFTSQQRLLIGVLHEMTPELIEADIAGALPMFLRAYRP